jgi:hypothetical protein
LGSLHRDGKDVPLQFEADGTYAREFVAGEWMANRQFNVRIVDLSNHCSADTLLVVEGLTPTPTPGRDCYITIEHVVVHVGEPIVVEGHGLTPGGRGFGLGSLQRDGKDIALSFSEDGMFRYEVIAEEWMFSEDWQRERKYVDVGVLLQDAAANCSAAWLVRILMTDWSPPAGSCWIRLTPQSAKSGDSVLLEGGGFQPNGTGHGLSQLEPYLNGTIDDQKFDDEGRLSRLLHLWWRAGEGLVEIIDDSDVNPHPCYAFTVVTVTP